MSDHCHTCRLLQAENDRLADDNSSLRTELTKKVYELGALTRKLNKQERKGTHNEVLGCLRLWRATCVPRGSRSRVNIDLDGDRAKITRRALNVLTAAAGDRADRRRLCMDAIRGKSLRPFESFGEWYPDDGPNRKRRNDVEHALGSERRIEEHAAYWRMARAATVDRRRLSWQVALHDAHLRLGLLAQADRFARFERQQPWPDAASVPVWMSDTMLRVLDRFLHTRAMDEELRCIALACALAAEHAYYEHEYRELHPEAPSVRELTAIERPRLFVIEGEAAA